MIKRKRIVSLLLVTIMLVSLFPIKVFAVEDNEITTVLDGISKIKGGYTVYTLPSDDYKVTWKSINPESRAYKIGTISYSFEWSGQSSIVTNVKGNSGTMEGVVSLLKSFESVNDAKMLYITPIALAKSDTVSEKSLWGSNYVDAKSKFVVSPFITAANMSIESNAISPAAALTVLYQVANTATGNANEILSGNVSIIKRGESGENKLDDTALSLMSKYLNLNPEEFKELKDNDVRWMKGLYYLLTSDLNQLNSSNQAESLKGSKIYGNVTKPQTSKNDFEILSNVTEFWNEYGGSEQNQNKFDDLLKVLVDSDNYKAVIDLEGKNFSELISTAKNNVKTMIEKAKSTGTSFDSVLPEYRKYTVYYINQMARLYTVLKAKEPTTRYHEADLTDMIGYFSIQTSASEGLINNLINTVQDIRNRTQRGADLDELIQYKIIALQFASRIPRSQLFNTLKQNSGTEGNTSLTDYDVISTIEISNEDKLLDTKKIIPPRINSLNTLQLSDTSEVMVVLNYEAYDQYTKAYDSILNNFVIISTDNKITNALINIEESTAENKLKLFRKLRAIDQAISAMDSYRMLSDLDTDLVNDIWKNTSTALQNSSSYGDLNKMVKFPQAYVDKKLKSWYDVFIYAKSLDFTRIIRETDNTEIVQNPFYKFINPANYGLQDHIVAGMEASSLYEPLKQKINDESAFADINDTTFWKEFLLRFGNYRKALLLDTTDQAPHSVETTGKLGGQRVATLNDLIKYPDEVVLTVDPGYYNLDELLRIAPELQFMADDFEGKEEDKKAKGTVGQRIMQSAKRDVDRMMSDLVPDIIESAGDLVTQFVGWVKDILTDKNNKLNSVLLGPDEIDQILMLKRYTPALGFALTSAIFRDTKFAAMLKNANEGTNRIVYMSSKSLLYRKDQSYGRSAFINYVQMKNSIENLQLDAGARSDLDKPIYVDIFGNIVTESGYVVVPVVTNATLVKKWSPYTVGFLTTFTNNKVEIEASEYTKFLYSDYGEAFESKDGKVVLRKRVEGGLIDIANLSTRNTKTRDRIKNLTRSNVISDGIDSRKYFANIFCEVMRGAPLSKIDKKKENIQTTADFLGFSKKQAWKFEQMRKELYKGRNNSIVATPSILASEQAAIPIAITVKITFLISLILILIILFIMGTSGKIKLMLLLKLLGVMIVSIVFTMLMPFVYTQSMYTMNKVALQEPILRTALLSLAKEQEGQEVSLIGQKENYTTKSEIDLKLESLEPDLLTFVKEFINLPLDEGIDKMFEDMLDKKISQGVPIFKTKLDGVYVSLNDVVNASVIRKYQNVNQLGQFKVGDTSTSFYTPYYMFIDSLLMKCNDYSSSESGKYRYNYKVYKGSVKTIGFIEDYFTSDEFADAEDIFSLKPVYSESDFKYFDPDNVGEYLPTGDIESIKNSAWYNDNISLKGLRVRVQKLDDYTKKLIYNNRELLGKIDDETFIRYIAICAAMKYNELFHIPYASQLDVRFISNDELIRFCIAPIADVEKGMSSSFARFVYYESNDIGVYLAAFLEILLFINGWFKYIFGYILFIAYYLILFIKKIVMEDWRGQRNDDERKAGLKSALMLLLIVVGMNAIYAFGMFASFKVPNMGLGPITSILFLILIQIAMLYMLSSITYKLVIGWRDLGYANFQASFRNFSNTITKSFTSIKDKISGLDKNNEGVKKLNELRTRDKARDRIGGNYQ